MARGADRIASDACGWAEPPPISRDEVSAIFGVQVTEEVWSEIEEVYPAFRAMIEAVKNAHTSNEWPGKVDRLDEMLAAVEVALREAAVDPVLLDGVASSVERETGAQDFGAAVRTAFVDSREANDRLRAVLAYSRNPALRPFGTEAEVKNAMARRLRAIFATAGLPTGLTEKERVNNELAETHMTAFERLTSALEIHVASTPQAHAKWLATAFKQDYSRRHE
jgi:hypothetical protein